MTFRHPYFPESGNSSKLALLLTLCGETFEPVWTDFGGGVPRTKEWRNEHARFAALPTVDDVCLAIPVVAYLTER